MDNKQKILIVDDEPHILTVLQVGVEESGYNVVTAVNGQEGFVKAMKEQPDLIISDVLMPVMDGFGFYKELKKSQHTSKIPIIILTARGKMEDTFKVMGVEGFVAKPFEAKTLIDKIDALLNQRKSQPAENPSPKTANKVSPLSPLSQKTGKKFLVASAEKTVAQFMLQQLEKLGCAAESAFSDEELFSKMVAWGPQILILEVLMDEKSSDEIVRALRQIPQFKKMPILVYSFFETNVGSESTHERALSIDNAQERCLEAGATQYLGRFDENTFAKMVRQYL